MKPFHEIVNKIKWSKDKEISDYTVGYYDRLKNEILETPLEEFLTSEIPEHRARYIKKKGRIVWDRRR